MTASFKCFPPIDQQIHHRDIAGRSGHSVAPQNKYRGGAMMGPQVKTDGQRVIQTKSHSDLPIDTKTGSLMVLYTLNA